MSVSSVPGRVLMILPGSRKVQLAVPVLEQNNTRPRTRLAANMRTFLALCLATSALAQTRLERAELVEVVKPQLPQAEPSFFARIVGDEGTARIVESISSWVNDKAKENPGCVENFVCEMYKTGETMSGLPYLVMSLTK